MRSCITHTLHYFQLHWCHRCSNCEISMEIFIFSWLKNKNVKSNGVVRWKNEGAFLMHQEQLFILRQLDTKCTDVPHLRSPKGYTHRLILAEATNTKTLDFWNPCLNWCRSSTCQFWVNAQKPRVTYKAFQNMSL